MAASSERKVLSYHDSLLTSADLSLLDGPKWLNDKLIAFAFEYFEFDEFQALADKVAFIGPEVTQCIKLSSAAEVGIFVEPLDLASKDYVFMAINDHSAVDTAGGSHWSLLVFRRGDEKFSHYDSAGSMNQDSAQTLSRKLHPFLKVAGDVRVIAEECNQQENGYDCGLFVICTAEHLCRQLAGSGGPRPELRRSVTGEAAERKRRDLRSLILSLSEEPAR